MRWFIAFLIVANVILYFWAQHQSRPLPGSSMLPSPDIGHLRLKAEVVDEPVPGSGAATDPPVAETKPETRAEPVVAEAPVTVESAAEASQMTDGVDNDAQAVPVAPAGVEDEPDSPTVTPFPGTPDSAQEAAVEAAEPLERPAEETPEAVTEAVPEQDGIPVGPISDADAPEQELASEAVASGVSAEEIASDVPVPEVASNIPVEGPGEPSRQTGPDDIEPASETGPPVVEVRQAVCVRVGPFESADADSLISALPTSVTLLSDDREDYETVDRYYVLIPPLPSRSAGRQKLKELADAGVTDTWLFPSGENRNAISLGFFSRERRAQRHAANIAKLGFDTEVKGRTSTRNGRWLVLKNAGDLDLASSLALPARAGIEQQACP